MKISIIVLFVGFVVEASAAIRSRQSHDTCCFGLSSVGVVGEEVKEDHSGGLSLGGPFQQGGFYDGGPGIFYACPVGVRGSQYYNIFSASKPDLTGCKSVALALYDSSAGCVSANNATIAAPTPRRPTPVRKQQPWVKLATSSTMSGYTHIGSAGLWSSITLSPSGSTSGVFKTKTSSTASIQTPKPSPICSISPSAPSIAPIRLGSPDKSAPGGIRDSSPKASITSYNSTVFIYSMSNSFLPPISDAKRPLCALQFRMPVCTELPKGYPCYRFSGLEQEFLADSGMNFDLIFDDGEAAWNGTTLHQVVPGETITLGTFECGAPKGSYGARKMGWHVSSVRNFSLEFLHAGVGNDAEFQDGIGAWIVPCQ